MLVNRLDSGDDFGTLAMNYSEDTETSGNGGDLGFTPESSLKNTDPVTRDAVIKLKPGQYSTVITVINPITKQLIGFRIVKLIAKESAGQRELSDPRVQEAIRSQLRDRREQLLKAAYYEVLRDQAKVENYYAQKVLEGNGPRSDGPKRGYSTIASTSPALTLSPSMATIVCSIPFFGDLISFCIFIASTTRMLCPASTG